MSQIDLLEVLTNIDPSALNYQEWLEVGMALKHEGYSVSDWDGWSRQDAGRYHAKECERKWNGFRGSQNPVTAGTIVQMAMERGWRPVRKEDRALDWDDIIGEKEDYVVIDKSWLENREIEEPENWSPAGELIRYLETLFESGENVGYVTESWKKTDEKGTQWLPKKGKCRRTAGELIEELNRCKDDLGAVLGDYHEEAGAWIRFNPMDGNGVSDKNVTSFRYALVESDNMPLGKQNAALREMELPIACLVYSGGKSLHAIVRIDAANQEEYRKRVDYLYRICQKNGLEVDTQNKNPSRLSRMPGVTRNGKKQFIVDTNIGRQTWNDWFEWIESINDDLPDPESLESVWGNLPELSPCLIENVLRKGHKMLIAGPSKAGKSFLQIELCIAIAEGRRWLGWKCAQGKVMYVNLELDRASCLHRFRDVYQALGFSPCNLGNIDIWNLRGKSVPMDKLAPKLIRRAAKKNYTAVVIDPIYKVITGDENSADQMANFCNQFDKVCTELGCAVIYCHHHSKGAQGGKRSMDRASGSGVFARDPDALLDLINLETTEALMKQEETKAVCAACIQYLDARMMDNGIGDWREEVSDDDLLSSVQMMEYCRKKLNRWQLQALEKQVGEAKEQVNNQTAWRIEGTLREFPKFAPVNLWFKYPVHETDDSGCLGDIEPEAEKAAWQKKKKTPEERKKDKAESFRMAFEALDTDGTGKVELSELVEYLGVTINTVKNRIKESKEFKHENGMAVKVSKNEI